MRALVTGAAGFVGQWLTRALLAEGWDVAGLTNVAPSPHLQLTPAERDAVRWITGDIVRAADVAAAVDDSSPDVIYHLAGISSVPQASGDPGLTCEVNVVGTARLLAAVRARRREGVLDPVVLVIGSGEQYGRHDPADLPLTEEAAQRPVNVYAATKAAQEVVALEAHRSEGVRVVATRPFNHSGAGQAPHFLLPALVGRALRLRSDGGQRFPIGNTTPLRDYLHVRDVVRAYMLLAARGRPGEVYNVCSGVGTTVGEVAARVLARVGVAAELERDPDLVRAVEVPALVGSAEKLRHDTGWEPKLSIDDIIDDLIHAATH